MTIPYTIAAQGMVNIYVTNLYGQRVLTLVSNQDMVPGTYQAQCSIYGLPAGVYFYTMETQGFRESKKLVIIKN
jgi:hypothetical protein